MEPILEKIASGSTEALQSLFAQKGYSVYKFAADRTSDREIAKRVTKEVFSSLPSLLKRKTAEELSSISLDRLIDYANQGALQIPFRIWRISVGSFSEKRPRPRRARPFSGGSLSPGAAFLPIGACIPFKQNTSLSSLFFRGFSGQHLTKRDRKKFSYFFRKRSLCGAYSADRAYFPCSCAERAEAIL